MPDLTVRNIPQNVLDGIRTLSAIQRRSMNSEILFLLEAGLARTTERPPESISPETQLRCWEALCGKWKTSPGEENLVNTVTEAKAQLSALLDRVCRGEEVIISRAGKPIAILEPYDATTRPRKPGALKGKIHVAADFDALTPEIEEMFGLETS